MSDTVYNCEYLIGMKLQYTMSFIRHMKKMAMNWMNLVSSTADGHVGLYFLHLQLGTGKSIPNKAVFILVVMKRVKCSLTSYLQSSFISFIDPL